MPYSVPGRPRSGRSYGRHVDERAPFDLAALGRSIATRRTESGLTWAELARQTGVSASTIKRFAAAADAEAEADGVLNVVEWLGVPPEEFVRNCSVDGVRLSPAGDGVTRVDMELIRALPAWPQVSRSQTRTTIQRLVAVAQESRRTVASLTCCSAV